jgi:hypothetical protein
MNARRKVGVCASDGPKWCGRSAAAGGYQAVDIGRPRTALVSRGQSSEPAVLAGSAGTILVLAWTRDW